MSLIFDYPFEFPQMMGIAKRMDDVFVTIIGFPVIVTKSSLVEWQYSHPIHRFFAPFFIGVIERDFLIGEIVQPDLIAININPSFVGVVEWRDKQLLFRPGFK